MRYLINESTLTNLADAIRYKADIESTLSPAKMISTINGLSTMAEKPLNFEIISSITEPTNPIENTIWINTDIKIGEWQILKDEPTTRVNGNELAIGDIWLMNENFRAVSFNPLKQNNLKMFIHTPKQWNGTSWDTKDGYIYQNGEWIEMIKILRIFPTDYACIDDNWTKGSNSGTFAMCSKSMYLYGHSDGSYRKLKGFPVDFSKYKTVNFIIDKMTNSSDFYFRWRKTSDDTLTINYKIDDLDTTLWVGTHTIDISTLTDECYLELRFDNGGGGYITDIWFEE